MECFRGHLHFKHCEVEVEQNCKGDSNFRFLLTKGEWGGVWTFQFLADITCERHPILEQNKILGQYV